MPKFRSVMTASLVASALAFTATPTAQAAPTAQTTPALDYVALGDSFSAGSGVLPVDPSNLLCLRSTANYPHVIAARTDARLTDVTCGGAQTRHFSEAQHPGTPPQTDALTAGTDLVTLTIGATTTTPSSTCCWRAAPRAC